jgi:hypothetical protein
LAIRARNGFSPRLLKKVPRPESTLLAPTKFGARHLPPNFRRDSWCNSFNALIC